MRVINISGEPGVGLTSLTIQTAYTTALEGLKVLFVNTEMTDKWLNERLLYLRDCFNGVNLTGSLESSNIDDVDVLQDVLDDEFYDLIVVDNIKDIEGYEQLNTNHNNNKLIILGSKVSERQAV